MAFGFRFYYKYIWAEISPGIYYQVFLSKKVESRRRAFRLINYFEKRLRQSAHLANYSKVSLSYYGYPKAKNTPEQSCPQKKGYLCVYK